MQSKSKKNPHYKTGQMVKRRIAVFCTAIMASTCVLVAEAVVKERTVALDRARIEAANISAGFEEQIRGTLNAIAGASEFLKDRIEEDEAKREAFDLIGWKSKVLELVSPGINISILDADGKVRATTLEHDPTRVSYSDRDFFSAHRDNPNLGFLIGKPVFGMLKRHMVIPATRRLNTRDGHFAGVLAFTLDPWLSTGLYRKVDLGKAGALNLFFNDGVQLAHYSSERGLDALRVGRKITLAKRAERGESGAFVKKSSIEGKRRIYYWRKVAGYPLIDVAVLDETEALADANRQAGLVIGVGMVALSLILIMMLMLDREISRRVGHAIALDEEAEKVRETNAELILAKLRAEDASRAKSAFLANMSHELRTPLNAVLGFSEIIRDKLLGKDMDRYASYAGDIHRSGAHLLDIVNDILDITRIGAGKFELREEKVNFHAVVQESLVTVEQQAATSGILLRNPASDSGASIFGDKTKLKQIVINLLSNAIKFTPMGGSIDIAVNAGGDGGLTLTIRDTGIGMSSEEIRDALELFHQVDNSLSRRFEGTGLGLPLAVQLTELHGGTLMIESTPGIGTAAVVRFPANRISWDQGWAPERAKAETNVPSQVAPNC
jgi:two-component system, cell cycle sensor histidine kinase PleC